MKIKSAGKLLAAVVLGAMLTNGCTTNTVGGAAEGAAVGAVSASFIGALTDLVVDGRVNTYRLKRNLVGGAIAGGTAGALAGAERDRAEARQQPTRPQTTVPDADAELIREIGETNYEALVDLLHFRHQAAYRKTLSSAKSAQKPYRLSALVIQALIDRDRKNEVGMEASLQQFVAEDDEIKDLDQAKAGLEDLYQELLDERRIRGFSLGSSSELPRLSLKWPAVRLRSQALRSPRAAYLKKTEPAETVLAAIRKEMDPDASCATSDN